MNGLIILDGPDGSGKTTLAKEIVRQTGGHYMHLTYRFKEKMFTYHLANLHRAVKLSATKVVVVDRLWMSELCYANAYRKGSKWPLAYRMLERIILKHAGLEVMCLPHDLGRHLREFEALKTSREEMYTDIAPVCIEYHKLWDKVKDWPHVRRYDFHDWMMPTDVPGVQTAADLVIKDMLAWQEEQLPEALDSTNYNLCGHISPAEFLFIGNSNTQRKDHWYPFVHYGGGSLHLAQVLEDLGLEEHRIMWTSYSVSPKETNELIPKYDLQPISFDRGEYNDWMAAHGGMDRMHVIGRTPSGLPLRGLTMTMLNSAHLSRNPDEDLRSFKGKSLKCDLGGYLLRKQAYGKVLA